MKKIEYLSPSSISLFYENLSEFYMKYLSDNRPPKIPQTQPMSIGSGFDAYVKSFLHEALVGKDPRFELTTIFEAQVEPQNRDFAWKGGAYCFMQYRRSGALADLMLELQGSVSTPRFEIEVKGVVNGYREGISQTVNGVLLLGKPDLFYINKDGANVIHDWKVNGFCSKYNVSPMQGYVRLRSEDGQNKGQHKNAHLIPFKGMCINGGAMLEDFNADWARQLAIYAWLCGEDVGADFIVSVDQIVCKPSAAVDMPDLRFAAHRLRTSAGFQKVVYDQAHHAWDICHSNHIFRDLSVAESEEKCKLLDTTALSLLGQGSEKDQWFAQATRG